uniref:Uncharacterized protein n=1 Tax=Anguilla anguilla TaxID=7936 RepID=A0A0E9PC67_ANGAN
MPIGLKKRSLNALACGHCM